MNNSHSPRHPLLKLALLCLPLCQPAWSQESASDAPPETEPLTENVSVNYEVATDSETQAISPAELDQLLAPVALYPDTILSHILVASTYPIEVVQAARWSQNNNNPEGSAALEAAKAQEWAPSVKALVQFPDLVQKMSEDLDWMQKLGDAFLQDEATVLAAVQNLRQQARSQGSLDNTKHLQVSDDDGDIIIEPVKKEVVYVPYYDTRVVYGPWWWSGYPPIHWHFARHSHRLHLGNPFYWGAGVYVGTGIYFSSFHWRKRHVVVVDFKRRHHYRYRNGRGLHRHTNSRRWRHNPRHRRGVAYRSTRVRHDAFSKRRQGHRYSHRREHNSAEVAQRLRERSRRYRSDEQRAASRSNRREHREHREHRNRDRSNLDARQDHRRREEGRSQRVSQGSRESQRSYREGQRNRNYREGQHSQRDRSRETRASNRDYRNSGKANSTRGYGKWRKDGQRRNMRNTRSAGQHRASGRRSERHRGYKASAKRSRRSEGGRYQRR